MPMKKPAAKKSPAKKSSPRKPAPKKAVAKPIPDGYHALTPYLALRGAADAIEFYKKAFGAKERMRMEGPGGKLMHAEIVVGDSIVMLADEFEAMDFLSPLLGRLATTSHDFH